MFYRKNLYTWEQALRIIVSLGAAAYGLYAYPASLLGYGIVVGAVVFALTGVVGWCPMCAMVGRKIKTAGE
jgi:Protein of unknown function (DUF2892)